MKLSPRSVRGSAIALCFITHLGDHWQKKKRQRRAISARVGAVAEYAVFFSSDDMPFLTLFAAWLLADMYMCIIMGITHSISL